MAYLRLGNIKEHKGSDKAKGLKNCIEYILNPDKTANRTNVGSYNFTLETGNQAESAYQTMVKTKEIFGKMDGRQGYHFKLSFAEDDRISPELALKITNDFCAAVFGDYECLYAVHDNTNHLHSHIVVNSVDIVEGRKYRYEKGDWAKHIQPKVNEICKKHGLSEIDLSMDEKFKLTHKCKVYSQWEIQNYAKKKEVFYSNKMILSDVEAAISKSKTYEDFLNQLQKCGHEVDDKGVHIRVRAPGRERFTRLYSLTEDKKTYTKENIKKMIDGTYLTREAVQERLFKDWNIYSMNHNRLKITRVRLEVLKVMEEQDLIIAHDLTSKAKIDDYLEYLRRADIELNLIKKRVTESFEARSEVLGDLQTLQSLLKHYDRYKRGDTRFYAEYQRVNAIARKIVNEGYNLTELYQYKQTGDMLLASVSAYKKHIYVETRIINRILGIHKNARNTQEWKV